MNRLEQLIEHVGGCIIDPNHAKIGGVSEISFDTREQLEELVKLIVREQLVKCMDICDVYSQGSRNESFTVAQQIKASIDHLLKDPSDRDYQMWL